MPDTRQLTQIESCRDEEWIASMKLRANSSLNVENLALHFDWHANRGGRLDFRWLPIRANEGYQ